MRSNYAGYFDEYIVDTSLQRGGEGWRDPDVNKMLFAQ